MKGKRKLVQANMKNKTTYKKAIFYGSLFKVFSKDNPHESQRIPLSPLMTLNG